MSELGGPRNAATDAYLQAAEPDESVRKEMQSARGAFGMWHAVSVMLNLAAIVCVTGATALAAHLPGTSAAPTKTETASSTCLAGTATST